MESNYQIPFDYKDNNFSENNNIRNEGYKSSRRSKNKIRITKGDNPAIIEYNLDISDINDESDNYLSEFPARNEFNKNKRLNNYKYNTSVRNKKDYQQYYNYFTKDIRPSVNTQFNIYSTSTHSKAVTPSNNTIISTISNINTKGNNLLNNETNSMTNNLISTPNFSEYGKTPKRPIDIADLNIKSFNNNEILDNNNKIISKNININFDEDTSSNKVLIKKRPKNEIPKPSLLNKRKNSTTSLNSKNSSSKLNININKSAYEICHNENINFEHIENLKEDENKLVFNNDNELVEYINKKYEDERRKKNYFNKKLRFTGFVLCKKYKGKNLYDIRIEDDIEKINQQFKEEQVLVNDKKVELKFIEEKKDFGDNEEKKIEDTNDINIKAELDEEIKKLKSENEILNKKDNVKNELITKLDKEKQKLLEEIEKLTNSIEELKNTNNKLIEEKNEKEKEEKNNAKIITNKNNIFTIEYSSLTIIDTPSNNNSNNNNLKENSSLKVNEENIIMNDEINMIDNININDINNNMDDDNKIENKENDNGNNNNHNDSYDNKHNTSLNNNQILSDIINGENIDEKINDINIENYCNNNNYSMDNNLNELNNNKNDFMDIIGNDQIIKIDEINNNINFEDNKDLVNIINESSNNDMDINNRSHPRINELIESEISERDVFK
jgi:hypothetical protein